MASQPTRLEPGANTPKRGANTPVPRCANAPKPAGGEPPIAEAIPGRPDQLVGRRLIERLDDHLKRLRKLPAHGNREFFCDQLVVAHFLAFFNPSLHSLRRIEDVFDLRSVRKRFGVKAAKKSTVSDAQRLFDPELLRPILDDLVARANFQPHDKRLNELARELVAVDGTFFNVASRIAWAVYNRKSDDGVKRAGRRGQTKRGNVRAHMHFSVTKGVPKQFSLTGGQAAEGAELLASLLPELIYALDRGFQSYELFGEIIAAGSDFVVRLRKTARCERLETLPLTATDLAAGVRDDALVRLGWRGDQTPDLPPLRRVEVAIEGHDEPFVLLTSCLDLSAEMIALIYKHRWQVELFFRWLKCMAHLDHFYSESPAGMTFQFYVTLIATVLLALETGARPSVYDFSLMSMVMSGATSLEEALPILARRRAERERAAQRQRERAAAKKNLG